MLMAVHEDVEPSRPAGWMRWALTAAGVYNIAWGLSALLSPNTAFDMMGLARPIWPQVWQCLGMVIGVYGVGYLVASTNPLRHWPLVFVGLLGKVFGPIGFVVYAIKGEFPWTFGWLILFNDVIWWLPFGVILWKAGREARQEMVK